MIRTAWRVILILLVVSLAGVAIAEGEQTLNGTFAWVKDDGESTGDLEAVFTKTGEGKWDVVFHFVWEGKPRAWEGTAQGSLSEGDLAGEVVTGDSDNPTIFKFKGSFTDGAFTGTHGRVREGKLSETGTITLGG